MCLCVKIYKIRLIEEEKQKNKTINFAPSKSLYSTVNVSKIKIFFHYAVVSEKRITTCHLFSFVFYLATSFLCHFLNHFFCFFCFFSQLFFGYCEKIIATKYRKRWLSQFASFLFTLNIDQASVIIGRYRDTRLCTVFIYYILIQCRWRRTDQKVSRVRVI